MKYGSDWFSLVMYCWVSLACLALSSVILSSSVLTGFTTRCSAGLNLTFLELLSLIFWFIIAGWFLVLLIANLGLAPRFFKLILHLFNPHLDLDFLQGTLLGKVLG